MKIMMAIAFVPNVEEKETRRISMTTNTIIEGMRKGIDGYDIVLRNCGCVGWLGILIDEFGNEIYRTGKHWPSSKDALTKVQLFINPI